jgi:hypothetical protein
LTEEEGLLPEKTPAISGAIATTWHATCAHHSPTISSIRPVVPEKHPSMTTPLEHLKSHQAPSGVNMPPGLTIAPTMQTIVVDCVSVVNPKLASIIRDEAEVVTTCSEDSHAACPTHGKVIASSKT